MTGNKFHKDKMFAKISHTASSGVVGDDEYEVLGEIKISVATTFATSGTLTVQGRIKHSTSWQTVGTLTSGGDFDTFDIDAYDFIRFNFTVAAGSTGEIAASGFFKAASGGGGAAFSTIQTDAGTSPVAVAADTLTLTSSDSSITITGNSTTDTVDFVVAGGGGDVSGPASSTDNAITRFDGTTGKIIQDYTSNPPTISDSGAISNTQGYTLTESFGAGQTITKANCAVFGAAAQSTGQYGIAVGWFARVAGNQGTTMGGSAYSTTGGTALGYGTNAGANSVSLGYGANTSGRSGSVAIGRSITSTANNQLVIGGPTSYRISEAYIGAGVTSSTAYDFTLCGTGGSGTDNACGNFYIKAGAGTGTGTGGHLIFQTAEAGTTGSTLNTYTTHIEITDDGNVLMANLPTSASGLPTGALWNNSGVINIA